MNEAQKTHISKFLSLLLRHQPETIGIILDANGWADVDELIEKSAAHGVSFSPDELDEIVDTNDKKRFAFNEDGTKIRASQGHSVSVDLKLEPVEPPPYLYHGTVAKFLDSILDKGLVKGQRQYVHLSKDLDTAVKVGNRRGKAVILKIDTGTMHSNGYRFFLSANGVWLTEAVPPLYIQLNN
jgi:putative RNA 2'-phosphotransferase